MSVKITTLIENSQGEHLSLKSEHGLSFLIEKDNHSILFDTGQSSNFLFNAAELRLDIAKVSHVVLSHGHYDHSGGFRSLAGFHSGFELILGPGFFGEKYGRRNGSFEYLGNDFDEKFLTDEKIAYRFVETQLTELVDGIYVVNGFERIHTDERINSRLVLRKGSGFEPDLFGDELLVAVDTPGGLIVILGCAHPGMKNMVDTVRKLLGRPVYAVLGGTHLVEGSVESVGKSIGYLSDESIQAVGVSHCTGVKAMEILEASNSRYFHNRTGTALFVD